MQDTILSGIVVSLTFYWIHSFIDNFMYVYGAFNLPLPEYVMPFCFGLWPSYWSRAVWVGTGLKLSTGMSCAVHLVLNWRQWLSKSWFGESKVCELLPSMIVYEETHSCVGPEQGTQLLWDCCVCKTMTYPEDSISRPETTALEPCVIFLRAPQ